MEGRIPVIHLDESENGEVFVKTRIISALVGIVLLAVVLSFFQTIVLNVAIMVIILMAMYEFLTATKISHNKLLSAVAFVVAAAFPYIRLQRELDLLPLFLLPYIALLFLILLRTHQDTRVEDIALVFMNEHRDSAVAFFGDLSAGQQRLHPGALLPAAGVVLRLVQRHRSLLYRAGLR